MRITIDRRGGPLYLQLAAAIRRQIESGALKPGDQLPTVRTLLTETGLSDGTIRHAYALLAREGVLDMSQGRGTFVCAPGDVGRGREARAMQLIDDMLASLKDLQFTPREIRLFLNLKLHPLEDEAPMTPVALIDCNPESLNEAAQQLSVIPGIALSEYLLDDVRRSPTSLTRGMRLLITTPSHAHELGQLLGVDAARIARVALSPSAYTLAALSRVEAGQGALIYCRSQRFAQIVVGGMRLFPHLRSGDAQVVLAPEALSEALPGKQAVIVAPDYLSYAPPADREALSAFAEAGGLVLPYHHQIDQGSLLYVEERLRSLAATGD